jgi:hypothetical protein
MKDAQIYFFFADKNLYQTKKLQKFVHRFQEFDYTMRYL